VQNFHLFYDALRPALESATVQVKAQGALWSWNTFSFWTSNDNRKFASFYIFEKKTKNHKYLCCLARM